MKKAHNQKIDSIPTNSDLKLSERDKVFYEAYQAHSSSVRIYCKLMLNDSIQAEDAFQETFIAYYNNLSKEIVIESTVAYLIGIAKNIILRYRRDKKITVDLDFEQFSIDESKNYEKSELMNLITSALELLDDIYKEPFILREFDGLSFNEISNVCGISVSNAKIRVYRAYKEIIKILNPYLNDLNRNN